MATQIKRPMKDLNGKPVKYRLKVLKTVVEDLENRIQLVKIGSEVSVSVAGDDIGLIIRQSINEAAAGYDTRQRDLKLLKDKIKELKQKLEKKTSTSGIDEDGFGDSIEPAKKKVRRSKRKQKGDEAGDVLVMVAIDEVAPEEDENKKERLKNGIRQDIWGCP